MSEEPGVYKVKPGHFQDVVVGDLDSDEKGTGARRNYGKPPMELIPVGITRMMLFEAGDLPLWLDESLFSLKRFQEGDNVAIWQALGPLAVVWPEIARVLDYGRQGKYKEWNWAKGMPWSVCFGCALRHAWAIVQGEPLDQDSGLTHAGHYGCNLVFLAHYVTHYQEGDDRPKVFWSEYDSVTDSELKSFEHVQMDQGKL